MDEWCGVGVLTHEGTNLSLRKAEVQGCLTTKGLWRGSEGTLMVAASKLECLSTLRCGTEKASATVTLKALRGPWWIPLGRWSRLAAGLMTSSGPHSGRGRPWSVKASAETTPKVGSRGAVGAGRRWGLALMRQLYFPWGLGREFLGHGGASHCREWDHACLRGHLCGLGRHQRPKGKTGPRLWACPHDSISQGII